jgi:hypothetical protein
MAWDMQGFDTPHWASLATTTPGPVLPAETRLTQAANVCRRNGQASGRIWDAAVISGQGGVPCEWFSGSYLGSGEVWTTSQFTNPLGSADAANAAYNDKDWNGMDWGLYGHGTTYARVDRMREYFSAGWGACTYPFRLALNAGQYAANQKTAWAVGMVLVYNRVLTATEFTQVSRCAAHALQVQEAECVRRIGRWQP